MNENQKRVRKWMQDAGQECPDNPTMPSHEVRRLRARLILEEALETINKGLGLHAIVPDACCDHPLKIDDVAFESGYADHHTGEITCLHPDLVELADGMADLQVVNLGTAVACGINLQPVFDEVCRSNESKYNWSYGDALEAEMSKGWNAKPLPNGRCCVTDETGKIRKGPDYSPANIQPILKEQGL